MKNEGIFSSYSQKICAVANDENMSHSSFAFTRTVQYLYSSIIRYSSTEYDCLVTRMLLPNQLPYLRRRVLQQVSGNVTKGCTPYSNELY